MLQGEVVLAPTDIRHRQVRSGGRQCRIELECLLEVFDRFVVAPLVDQQHADHGAIQRRRRLERLRVLHLLATFVEAARDGEVQAEPLVCRRIVRAELDGARIGPLRAGPVVLVLDLDVAERRIRFAQLRRQFECPVDRLPRLGKNIVRRSDAEDSKHGIAFCQSDVRQGEVRIAFDRLPKEFERCSQPRFVSAPPMEASAGVQLVGFRIIGVMPERRRCLARQFRGQRDPYLRRNRVLHGKDIREILVVTIGPQLAAVADVHEPRRDAQAVPITLQMSLQHGIDAQLAAGRDGVVPRIGITADCTQRAHDQPGIVETRDQRLRHAEFQGFVAVGSGQWPERQHRKRLRRKIGCGRSSLAPPQHEHGDQGHCRERGQAPQLHPRTGDTRAIGQGGRTSCLPGVPGRVDAVRKV